MASCTTVDQYSISYDVLSISWEFIYWCCKIIVLFTWVVATDLRDLRCIFCKKIFFKWILWQSNRPFQVGYNEHKYSSDNNNDNCKNALSEHFTQTHKKTFSIFNSVLSTLVFQLCTHVMNLFHFMAKIRVLQGFPHSKLRFLNYICTTLQTIIFS